MADEEEAQERRRREEETLSQIVFFNSYHYDDICVAPNIREMLCMLVFLLPPFMFARQARKGQEKGTHTCEEARMNSHKCLEQIKHINIAVMFFLTVMRVQLAHCASMPTHEKIYTYYNRD